MCLYPRLIQNKKYMPTKKNNYNAPVLTDERVKYVSIGCGKCLECRKQKANAWRIRLIEEIKVNQVAQFVTLTFNEESIEKLQKDIQTDDANAICTIAVRRFLERWRKKYKKSVKHWLISEMGHNGTERVHLHGLIWTANKEEIEKIWAYGWVYIGEYVNNKTINYIVKYVTKLDTNHKGFEGLVLTSAGIGKAIKKDGQKKSIIPNLTTSQFNGEYTHDYYRAPNGARLPLPAYYRNIIYNEDEREKLWINKIEQHRVYVLGIEYKLTNAEEQKTYFQALKNAQRYNTLLGYGDNSAEWKKTNYKAVLRKINAN